MGARILVLSEDQAVLDHYAHALSDLAHIEAVLWPVADLPRGSRAAALIATRRAGEVALAAARFVRGLERTVPMYLVAPPEQLAALAEGAAEFTGVIGEPVAGSALCARLGPHVEVARLDAELRRTRDALAELRDHCAGLSAVLPAQGAARALLASLQAAVTALCGPATARDAAPVLPAATPPAPERSPAPLRLNDEVRTVMDALIPEMPPGIRIETRFAPRVISSRLDPRDLEEMVRLLVESARDAMPSGGRLVVETFLERDRPGESRTRDLRVPFAAVIAVSDSGSGADAAAAHFAVRRTVEGCGGSLRAVHVPGRGSTVYVHLPVAGAGLAAVPDVTGPVAGGVTRGLVLVVEDDDALRDMTRTMLEASGYTVLTAPSAEHALSMIEGKITSLSLLLTDIVLPGASGVVLSERMRSLYAELPVLYMTAHPEVLDARRASVVSHVRCLRKPFSVDELLAEVERAVPRERAA